MTTLGDAWERVSAPPQPQPPPPSHPPPVPANVYIEPPVWMESGHPATATAAGAAAPPQASHSLNVQQLNQMLQSFLEVGDQRRDHRDNRLFFAMENMLGSHHSNTDHLARRQDIYTSGIVLGVLLLILLGFVIYGFCSLRSSTREMIQIAKNIGMGKLQVEDLVLLATE